MEIVIIIITTLLPISVGAALIFWNRVLQWAFDSLFPWVDVNIPNLASIVREAFAILDNIGAPTRRSVKQSWEKVRQYLLKQTLQFQKQSSDTWVRRVTSWLIPFLHSSDSFPKVNQRIETVDVDFYDLPDDVRQAFIRREEKMTELDTTKTRDEELARYDDDDLAYEN